MTEPNQERVVTLGRDGAAGGKTPSARRRSGNASSVACVMYRVHEAAASGGVDICPSHLPGFLPLRHTRQRRVCRKGSAALVDFATKCMTFTGEENACMGYRLQLVSE
ncbi:unnamed protein product, partial [Iphiclides podalirius]